MLSAVTSSVTIDDGSADFNSFNFLQDLYIDRLNQQWQPVERQS